jgi:hypothetical protein
MRIQLNQAKGYEMTNELAVVNQDVFIAPVVTVKNALDAYQAKKDLIDGIMKVNVDYGKIPGTDKPTLLKAGAEKATSFFGLSPRFTDAEVVNDWTGENHGGEPFFFYRRTCNLYRGNVLVASVDGSCNSWEKKYRYRGGERVCPECGKATIKKSKFAPKGRPDDAPGFYCYSKIGGCGAEFEANDPAIVNQKAEQSKNPDVSDLVNTILKMADKRALVAATLIATGLSEYFTQDVDDFVDAKVTDVPPEEPPAEQPKTAAKKPASKDTHPYNDAKIVNVFAKEWGSTPAEAAKTLATMHKDGKLPDFLTEAEAREIAITK